MSHRTFVIVRARLALHRKKMQISSQIADLGMYLEFWNVNEILTSHVLLHSPIFDAVAYPTAATETCAVSLLPHLHGCDNLSHNSSGSLIEFGVSLDFPSVEPWMQRTTNFANINTRDRRLTKKLHEQSKQNGSSSSSDSATAATPYPAQCCKYFAPGGARWQTKLDCPPGIGCLR